jgi:hypothetical protein
VLANYEGKCALTGIDLSELLVASHIIPWADNEQERLNPENGICLSSLYDKAFDKGLISFTNEKHVIFSIRLKENVGKEYYAKYPGKFEILGVDCNDTEEKWKAAVKHHDLPWLHVYCPSESTVLADYGVTGFPTKIIIGPDGKIVRTIVGEDPSFYTLLDELFGQ